MGRLLKEHVSHTAHLNTDESPLYKKRGKAFASHDTVNYTQEQYGRQDVSGRLATTDTVQGVLGNTKRSLDGTRHQVSS